MIIIKYVYAMQDSQRSSGEHTEFRERNARRIRGLVVSRGDHAAL